LRADFASWESP